VKHKNSNLPIAPENWSALKRTVPGLSESSRLPDVRVLAISSDYCGTLSSLKEHGLRAMTYPEALVILSRDANLKEKLKGKDFWIDGVGIYLNEWYYVLQPDGSLISGLSSDREKNVSVIKNQQMLLLVIYSDQDCAGLNWRYVIRDSRPNIDAPSVAVGIPQDIPVNSICENLRRQS